MHLSPAVDHEKIYGPLVQVPLCFFKMCYSFLLAAYRDFSGEEQVILQPHFRKKVPNDRDIGSEERGCIDQRTAEIDHCLDNRLGKVDSLCRYLFENVRSAQTDNGQRFVCIGNKSGAH